LQKSNDTSNGLMKMCRANAFKINCQRYAPLLHFILDLLP
jgi:hypothetical protein